MDKEELADEMYNFLNEMGQMSHFLHWANERGFEDLTDNVEEVFEN